MVDVCCRHRRSPRLVLLAISTLLCREEIPAAEGFGRGFSQAAGAARCRRRSCSSTQRGGFFPLTRSDTGLRSSAAANNDAAATASVDSNGTASASASAVVSFLPFPRLMDMDPGEFETSDPITIRLGPDGRVLRFCVKLYPKGGGHGSEYTVLGGKRTKSGFGMSYKVLPFFSRAEDKVGVYLQYLPEDEASSNRSHAAAGESAAIISVVDASFALRMLGRQKRGPRFDVEFRSGMRFVSDPSDANLREGRARDFGTHLMQTSRLVEFLGIDDDEREVEASPIQVQVSILVHNAFGKGIDGGIERYPEGASGRLASLVPREIRGTNRLNRHDADQVRVGRIVVPVLSELAQRPRLFQLGAYPGVEYRVMRVVDPETDQDVFYSQPGADYELRPIYPLVQQLERPWPVRVNERDLPKLYTPTMYNTISALASLATAVAGLWTAFCISQAVSLFFIPSHSMDPTLQVGDVLLVEKVTPRLLIEGSGSQVGDVVLFYPPQKLQEIVSRSGGRKLSDRDLFVKRVAAMKGDVVTVEANGDVKVNHRADGRARDLCEGPGVESYIQPGELALEPGEVAVLGDCARVSIDSRVWGPLPTQSIVGRPLLRLWPLSRFGSIPSLPVIDL